MTITPRYRIKIDDNGHGSVSAYVLGTNADGGSLVWKRKGYSDSETACEQACMVVRWLKDTDAKMRAWRITHG